MKCSIFHPGWYSLLLAFIAAVGACDERRRMELDTETRERCVRTLREGLSSDEFWPAMHAAEALSLTGHAAEVRAALAPKLVSETDDQRRCGLARELVRAGDRSKTQVMVDVLRSDNPYGHVHACESLYKVFELGDDARMRDAMVQRDNHKKSIMAAAALARWGSPVAMQLLRESVNHEDGEIARIAAWVLGRVGTEKDVDALRDGSKRFTEPLTRAYFEYALAALGDAEGVQSLIRNLNDQDPAVRVYACEFAVDARAVAGRQQLIALLDDPVLDVRIRAAQALLQLASEPPMRSNEVLVANVFSATSRHPRYSEGSIVVLRDGRLLYATTEFSGSGSDFAAAQIISVESADGGRTWRNRRVLQENVGRNNVMSATLRRLSNPARYDAPIGFFYLVKNSTSDLQVLLRQSQDEAVGFGEPVLVTNEPGYHVLNNDRVTVLRSGRIIVPVSSTADVGSVNHFICSCFISDDQGSTWHRSKGRVDYPQRGAMEPEVFEGADGRLVMHIRTQLGHIAISYSADQGETWSPAESWGVRAPEAPATVRRIPSTGDLLLIWNDTFTPGAGHGGRRTPLTAAVSKDEGRTWTHQRQLETRSDHTYAYTSVAFDQGRALLTYYVAEEKSGFISSRFRSVPISWFYQAAATE